MVIGLVDKFNAPGLGELLKKFEDLGVVLLELGECAAADGEGDLELSLVALDELEEQGIHGNVALFRVVLVEVVGPNVEKRVVLPQPERLVDLEIKAE